MRLPEKTIELTYCSQLSAGLGGRSIWFGLTQAQEKRAGFDACTRLGGRLFMFQFKASCQDVRRARRFHLPHQQLVNLRARCRGNRSVFYALPMVGTTRELSANSDVVGQTWLLDVAALPAIRPPTTGWGSPRKSQRHYLDLYPPRGVLHSAPIDVQLLNSSELSRDFLRDSPGALIQVADPESEVTSGHTREFGRHAVGLVLLP